MPFQPGNNANPRGRPKTGTSIAEYIRKIGGDDGKIYVDELHTLATTHEDARVKISALGLLLERGFGKPPQDLNLSGQVDSATTVIHEYHDKPPAP